MITTDKCYENKEQIWGYRENEPMGGYDPYSSSKGAAEIAISSWRRSFFNPADYDNKHHVSVSLINDVGSDSYYDMLPLYYNATASIIPLKQNLSWCCGATIIFQSIAMRCPLIVSECQANVIDAEKEGVGLNVRIGSKKDIIDSVTKLSSDNEFRDKCSKNGIALSLTRYNYDIFCRQLIGYVKTFIE